MKRVITNEYVSVNFRIRTFNFKHKTNNDLSVYKIITQIKRKFIFINYWITIKTTDIDINKYNKEDLYRVNDVIRYHKRLVESLNGNAKTSILHYIHQD